MIFGYDELKEAVREDFERFYQMGFNARQILPAVLNEYKHGEGFDETENLCIHIVLALQYQEAGFVVPALPESIHHFITEESYDEILTAPGTQCEHFTADLSILKKQLEAQKER